MTSSHNSSKESMSPAFVKYLGSLLGDDKFISLLVGLPLIN